MLTCTMPERNRPSLSEVTRSVPEKPLTEMAQTTSFTLTRTRYVLRGPGSYDQYVFAYCPQPLDFKASVGTLPVDFTDPTLPQLLPIQPGLVIRGERDGQVVHPLILGAFERPFLEALAEEVFDVGRLNLELARVPAPQSWPADLDRFSQNAQSGQDGIRVAESLATVIAVDFLRAVLPQRTPVLYRERHPGVRRAHREMLERYALPWTIAQLAAVAHLSVTQFLVVFRQEFGCAPHERLRQIRVDAAKGRLARGHEVFEVAVAVGFASGSGFRAAFKTLVGASPLEYQKSRRQPPGS